MGKTTSCLENISEIIDNNNVNKKDGLASNNILGTYIHGVFDSGDVAGRIVDKLREEKGLENSDNQVDIKLLKEQEYEKLAYIMQENINMKKVYEILEKGV